MKITQFTIEKSLTIGVQAAERTKYRKITLSATAELAEGDDYQAEYKKVSNDLEEKIAFERTLFVNSK